MSIDISIGHTIVPAEPAGLTYQTNLYAWFKADALTLNDNDPVETWTDSTLSGRDLTQSNADYKPLYKTNILNGKPAVRLDGTNDLLDSGTWNLNQPYSRFWVVKRLDSNNTFILAGTGGTRADIWGEIGNVFTNCGAQQTVIASDPLGSFHYYTQIVNGASSNFRYDGAHDVSHNPGTNKITVFRIGSTFSGYEGNIDICELLIYNEAISDANRNIVETYLKTKYGL